MVKMSTVWLKRSIVGLCDVASHCSSSTDSFVVCRLIYLPAYSPDYNPIEQAFSSIKAYLRHHGRDAPLLSIAHACQNITPDKAEEYFRASGYIM
jgi:transposase